MDYMMPIMDGCEATLEIRKLPESFACMIVGLSAIANQKDIDKCLRSGMDKFSKIFQNILILFFSIQTSIN